MADWELLGATRKQEGNSMSVYIKHRPDGLDPRWTGSWMENGKRYTIPLNRWRGIPPGPGEEFGDAAFEKSRGEAEAKLAEARVEMRKTPGAQKAERLVEKRRLQALKYDLKVREVTLDGLAEAWGNAPHRKQSEGRKARILSVIRRFVGFMAERFPNVKNADAVTGEQFAAFMADIEASGVTGRTWNDYLDILREVIRLTGTEGAGYTEYLAELPHREQDPESREPMTDDEQAALFAAAREVDPELYPVLLAAVSTGMRRGDLALLRWESVDTAEGFITAKAHKTHRDVEVPLDDPFLSLLEAAERARDKGNPYVFPAIAKAYKDDPKSLNRRLNKILAAAGFAVPTYPSRNVHGKKGATPSPRMRGGTGRCTVAEAQDGQSRKYRASKVGWHAFRTSFVTAALSRGVDPGVVMAITGHTNIKTLFTHYDRRAMKTRRRQMRDEWRGGARPSLPSKRAALVQAGGGAEVVTALPAGFADLLAGASREQLAAVAALLGGCRK